MLSENLTLVYPAETDFQANADYLRLLVTSREADTREGISYRQGRGTFCLPSAGHENMAAIAYALEPDDYIYCHYRDRALLLARGVSLHSIALGYFAKAGSSSAGRQLASHFSAAEHNVVSCASPTASQCLPATGTAWAAKMDGKQQVIVCCVGEASTRQGEFYEAVCMAIQESLPIIFVVEDNGYGISTPTERMTPLNMNVLPNDRVIKINGRHAENVYSGALKAALSAREGNGPSILWVTFDRLMSHTSSDDQRIYRPQKDLEANIRHDPILLLRNTLFEQGHFTAEAWDKMQEECRETVRGIYESAEMAEEPSLEALNADVCSQASKVRRSINFLAEKGDRVTYAAAVNRTLEYLLDTNKKVLLFGQDIEDPKGGVFGLTKGLSTQHPDRVFNSPLAEATICGTAVGLAVAGYIPVFEIQFVDFIATGFNQIANQMATLRWRTAGEYKCPLVLLAPCGGYITGGGPWHTQTNEALFAHIPGLQVYMPSNACDVADLILNCASGEDPCLILLPKHLFFREFTVGSITSLQLNAANILKEGNDVTLLTWGNCVELALEASEKLKGEQIEAEVIDLKAIVPCDMRTISNSISKTGRLVVIHEDNRTCSVGQSIISRIVSDRHTWNMLYAPPVHLCRDDVLIPFNTGLARQVLPTADQIIVAAKSIMGA